MVEFARKWERTVCLQDVRAVSRCHGKCHVSQRNSRRSSVQRPAPAGSCPKWVCAECWLKEMPWSWSNRRPKRWWNPSECSWSSWWTRSRWKPQTRRSRCSTRPHSNLSWPMWMLRRIGSRNSLRSSKKPDPRRGLQVALDPVLRKLESYRIIHGSWRRKRKSELQRGHHPRRASRDLKEPQLWATWTRTWFQRTTEKVNSRWLLRPWSHGATRECLGGKPTVGDDSPKCTKNTKAMSTGSVHEPRTRPRPCKTSSLTAKPEATWRSKHWEAGSKISESRPADALGECLWIAHDESMSTSHANSQSQTHRSPWSLCQQQ